MSDSLGSENFSGSASTRAARHSFGNPNPMVAPSFENARKTIRPTRNFTRPRTNASLLRGSVAANSRTSSTVTGTYPGYERRNSHGKSPSGAPGGPRDLRCDSRVPCDHRSVANARGGSDVVAMLGQLVGAAAGLVALLYAAGGGVLALRLYLAHLPSRTIAAQLPRDLLISVGLAQIILPVLAVASLYVTWRILRRGASPPTRLVDQWNNRSARGWFELVGASALPALVVTATLGLAANNVHGGSK